MKDRTLPNISPVKKGNPISANWINKLAKIATTAPEYNAFLSQRGQLKNRPFEPFVRYNESAWQIYFSPGYVIDTDINDPTKMKQVDGIQYDPLGEPEWHTIDGNQAAYVEMEVDQYGHIVDDPYIVIEAQNYTVDHYEPQAGDDAGVVGKQIWKICDFNIVDATYEITEFLVGTNPAWYGQRPAFANLAGTGTENRYTLMKDWLLATDEYRLRVLKQMTGGSDPVSLLKPLTDPKSDEIQVRYIEGTDGVIVEETGDGNGVRVKLENEPPSGVWGTFQWALGSSPFTVFLGLTFENGVLTNAFGDNTTGTGTQVDPFNGFVNVDV